MIHLSETGRIADGFYCLGHPMVPSFVLDGDNPVMFEAGVCAFGTYYMKEIERHLGERRPGYLFITHMHYDHCGAAGYMKSAIPGLRIGASEEAVTIIEKPSAVDLIARLNGAGGNGCPFQPFTVDRILKDGEVVPVAPGRSVQVIKSPGHTRDMLSYFVPELGIMIPSEAVGVPGMDEYVFSEFLTDYDVYLDSLMRLSAYPIEILILAHGVYLTGEDVKGYLARSVECSERFRERLEILIGRYGDDLDAVASVVKKEEYDPLGEPKQPEDAYMLNLIAKIKAVGRRMKEKSSLPEAVP